MLHEKRHPRPSAAFLRSAADFNDIPQSTGREFCVLGRSNVGKSSFINHVFSNGGLARVSKTPGKTTLANFYRVSDGSVWADLPGYGFASRARTEQVRWSRLVAQYCEYRKNLCGVIWLCDSRHPGQVLDREAFAWFASLSLPWLLVLTKADKLTAQEQAGSLREYGRDFASVQPPVLYSTRSEDARDRFWEQFTAWAGSL
jgi:GTP-binding protein